MLGLGFRPFFLLAGLSAGLLVMVWAFVLAGGTPPVADPLRWHAHEMLFGFTVAVIAGFLLTAVPNWTGRATPTGGALAALAALWLLGRVLPLTALPAWLVAAVDLAFLPVLVMVILRPILAARQHRNLVVAGILGLLFAANLMVHLEELGVTVATAAPGIRLAWLSVVLLLVLMGGRVIPFFVEAGTGRSGATRVRRWVEQAGVITMIGWVLAMLAAPLAMGTALLAIGAGLAQAGRMVGWHVGGLWRNPMLWVLYLGYAWIPVGLVFYGATALTGGYPLLTLHSFTAGAIGTLALGMMARVSLGHTGREMRAPAALVAAFVLVLAGGLTRVFGPYLAAGPYHGPVVVASGILWGSAFLLFTVVFAPLLLRPRIDGRPG